MFAAHRGSLRMVEYLAARGAEVDAKTQVRECALA